MFARHRRDQDKVNPVDMEEIRQMSSTVLLAGAALVACVVLASTSALRRTPKDAPPIVRMGMPVLGNILAFLRSPVFMAKECYEK